MRQHQRRPFYSVVIRGGVGDLALFILGGIFLFLCSFSYYGLMTRRASDGLDASSSRWEPLDHNRDLQISSVRFATELSWLTPLLNQVLQASYHN